MNPVFFVFSVILQIMVFQFRLIDSQSLPEFPSGSSILLANDKLYLVGDDANNMVILDKNYRKLDQVALFDYPAKRIPKDEKVDLEGAVLLNTKHGQQLMAFGSASEKNRQKIVCLSITRKNKKSVIDYGVFINRLARKGINEVNIEGATLVGDEIIFVNRGNNFNRKNYLITTSRNFWEDQKSCPIQVHELIIPSVSGNFLGVSEVHYAKAHDLLLFTFTSEETSNAYDDGVIGESYLGWITSAKKNPKNRISELTKLSDIDANFKGQKIEGVCAERIGENKMILHFVADNDQGESKLFKVQMNSAN